MSEPSTPERPRRPAVAAPASLPSEIVLLPLLNVVIYPLTVTPLAIGQEAAVRLVDEAIADHRVLGLVALTGQARPAKLSPADFFRIGTAALVHRMVRLHDNTLRVAVEGVARFEVLDVLQTEPVAIARIAALPDQPTDRAARAEARSLVAAAQHLAQRLPARGAPVLEELAGETDPQRLSFLAAARLLQRGSLADRQQALELTRPAERLASLRRLIERHLAALDQQ